MTGEMLCRIRLRGPIPGKNPNSVGADVTEKRNRLPCCTKLPPVLRFRTANACPASEFPIPSTGCSFHDPRKSTGRLIPVSQSIELWKSPVKNRVTVNESVGFGVDGSSTRNDTESRPVDVWSFTWIEFCQLKAPNRTGVSKLSAVIRLLPVWAIVSSTPPGSTCTNPGSAVLEVVLLVKLSPGDQVTLDPIAIGTGESVNAGRSCWTLPSVKLCRRLPPSVSV